MRLSSADHKSNQGVLKFMTQMDWTQFSSTVHFINDERANQAINKFAQQSCFCSSQ